MPAGSWLTGGLGPLPHVFAIAVVVAILSRGQAFLVPVALAVFLAFVLHPLVHAMERLRAPRLVAIGVVLALGLSFVGAFTYVLTAQFRELAVHMPEYSTSIRNKLATLRGTRQGAIANIQKTVENVTRELDKQERVAADAPPTPAAVQPVAIVPRKPTDVERLRMIVTPVVEPLLEAGVVIVLVAFLLMQREDLRNRVIRLVGTGRMTLATRTMDEAGQRISRYLLTQSAINATFGLAVTGGLLWIGVPYALLWGTAAALLRFVPYVGALLAMAMPTAIAGVQFEGWWHALATMGLFVGLDALTANVVEPVVIGPHTGVSSLALLVAALFWAWLWGPIGLLLSTPITLCLAVLGKHVPQLEFLGVLLGDEAVLEPEVTVYQRLLAGDEDEANEIVDRALETATVEEMFDAVLLPAVVRSARDRATDQIADGDHQFVLRVAADVIARLGDPERTTEPGTRAVVALAARAGADEVAIAMLGHVLDPHSLRVHPLSPTCPAAEIVAATAAPNIVAVCIAALPPGGLANARYLCKRLRAGAPRLPIIVIRPGAATTVEGAERTGSLIETRRHLEGLGLTPPAIDGMVLAPQPLAS